MNKNRQSANAATLNEANLMTTEEVAAMLVVPIRTVEKWRENPDHTLKYGKVGRHVRYRRADVDAFVDACFAGVN